MKLPSLFLSFPCGKLCCKWANSSRTKTDAAWKKLWEFGRVSSVRQRERSSASQEWNQMSSSGLEYALTQASLPLSEIYCSFPDANWRGGKIRGTRGRNKTYIERRLLFLAFYSCTILQKKLFLLRFPHWQPRSSRTMPYYISTHKYPACGLAFCSNLCDFWDILPKKMVVLQMLAHVFMCSQTSCCVTLCVVRSSMPLKKQKKIE